MHKPGLINTYWLIEGLSVYWQVHFVINDYYQPMIRSSVLIIFLITSITVFSQDISEDSNINEDSITTPFRKGRWLSGLSGSISSGSTKIDTSSTKAFTNQYSFDFATGKFFKDRWLLGGIFQMHRDNSRQFVDLESETVLIAPQLSYYLSDNPHGSVFLSLALGYASFREKTVVLINGMPSQETLKGDGFGLIAQFGYSYVLHDRIAFDLGLTLNEIWGNAERELDGGLTNTKLAISTGNLLFTFGFKVILGEFFF